MKMPK